MNYEFHFGATPESNAFFDRHPKFWDAFERLMALTNRTFGREYKIDRSQEICFELGEKTFRMNRLEMLFQLGQTCRVDFFEIACLTFHAFGIGASKLLRGLYERSVALAYIIKHPEKAERFVKFATIQESKLVRSAIEHFGKEAVDEAFGTTALAQIEELREMIEPEFRVPVCPKCHKQGTCPHMETAFSWDANGVLAQAQDIGGPYTKYYRASKKTLENDRAEN